MNLETKLEQEDWQTRHAYILAELERQLRKPYAKFSQRDHEEFQRRTDKSDQLTWEALEKESV